MPHAHCCVRIYNNGDRVVEHRTPAQLDGWLQHNRAFRFGCALFVDGHTQHTGYLGRERCEELALGLQEEMAAGRLKAEPARTPRSGTRP